LYRARDPLVMGLGFAAARDLGAFLKGAEKDSAGKANPVVHGKQVKAIVTGSTQGGRMIRTLLLLGFNKDEAGARVFDGALPYGGAGLQTLNVRFAQPGRSWGQQVDHLTPGAGFPFAYGRVTDPITGRTQGVLDRCAADDTCPRIFQIATAADFWEGPQSLALTDPLGREDLHEPANVRSYALAGSQHTPAALPLPAPAPFGPCVQQPNPASNTWTMRALLADLIAWVRDDEPPPPSSVPRLGDGTLVAPVTNPVHVLEYGPGFRPGEASGVLSVEPPGQGAASYAVLVPQVDADGIDTAGIRSIYQLVPIGTYTGWNLFRPGQFGGDGLCALQGSFVPFAPTMAERQKAGDPRLSLEERYPTAFAYALAVRHSADILVRRRFMLPEDAERVAAEAERGGVRSGP
jgi:hypothetical protein